jgi:serine/threonine protein kinase
MNGSDTTLIIIILVTVLGGPVLGYLLYKMIMYIHQQYKRQRVVVPPLEDRKAAFSVGGNLVREVNNVPITDVYQVSKTLLGRGSSAEVIIGEHMKNRRRYAIKIIDNTRKEVMWRYDREKNFLRDIDHTNVVRLYEVYTYKQSMFFVMELCTGGHLGKSRFFVLLSVNAKSISLSFFLILRSSITTCPQKRIS